MKLAVCALATLALVGITYTFLPDLMRYAKIRSM